MLLWGSKSVLVIQQGHLQNSPLPNQIAPRFGETSASKRVTKLPSSLVLILHCGAFITYVLYKRWIGKRSKNTLTNLNPTKCCVNSSWTLLLLYVNIINLPKLFQSSLDLSRQHTQRERWLNRDATSPGKRACESRHQITALSLHTGRQALFPHDLLTNNAISREYSSV